MVFKMRDLFPYISAKYHRWGRRARLLFLLFLVVAFFYYWNTQQTKNFFASDEPKTKQKVREEKPFERVGEKITYDVDLGSVRIGTAEYENLRKTTLNGRPVYVISFRTRALRFQDQEEIFCDAGTFLPLVVNRKVSQFLKPEKITEEYDQKNYVLTIKKKRFGEEESVIRKNEPIHNSILLPFFVRKEENLRIGWSFEANLPQGKYKIILKAIEAVKVPSGTYESFYFESEPEKIKIWISNDKNRIPLMIEGTGGIGYQLKMRDYFLPEKEVPLSR